MLLCAIAPCGALFGAIGCSSEIANVGLSPENVAEPCVEDVPYEHSEYTHTYYLDPSSPPSLLKAAETWNAALGEDIFSTDCIDCPPILLFRDETIPYGALSFHRDDTGACGIMFRENVVEWVPTWIHELGHCLGLGHSLCEESVMYPGQNINYTISNAVVQLLNQ